jgi:probable rRNA maturation factor
VKVLEAVCRVLNVSPTTVEANFAFVSGRIIRDLNRKFRGIDKETDVLSFPDGDVNPETGKKFLGDVLICKSRARRQAKEIGQSAEREILFLQIHGLLHLFGLNHENEYGEKNMCEKQKEVLYYLDGVRFE